MVTRRYPPWEIVSLERQLDVLVDTVRVQGDRPDDEQMWLTRFLVVRACGYLEQVVHQVALAHLTETSGGTARSWSVSWLSRSRNPSPENLIVTVGRFDPQLQSELESLLDADDGHLRRELALLVDRRHQIAHGLNEGLGSRKAIDLVSVAKEIADWFIRELNPDPAAKRRTISSASPRHTVS